MTIDWFTFTAQIINFLVLVWLLSKFLYQPIIDAMDERERRMAAAVEETQSRQAQAEATIAEYQRKTEELSGVRESLLAEAAEDIEKWRSQRIAEARADVDRSKSQWMDTLRRERTTFLHELRRRIAEQVRRTSEKLLGELADADLQSHAVRVFLRKLDHLEPRSALEAVRAAQSPIRVESGFELTTDQKALIREDLQSRIDSDVELDFHVNPELIFGVELAVAGYKVAWSAHEQLKQLDEEFVRTLQQSFGDDARPSADSLAASAAER